MKIVADANIPFVVECFSSIGDVQIVGGRQMTPSVVAGAEVLLVRSVTPVNEALLAGSKVQFVATATIGFDHVDVDFLQRHGIGFASAPGSNANSAAEYIIAAVLEIGRRHKIRLEGKSIGVIGVGNVGSRVVKKCEALGMRAYLNDPPLQRQTRDPKYLPIGELFDCDFLTLHTPLTFEGIDKTFHLAGERFFESLKDGCVFLNAARGGVVDSRALKAAVASGRLKAVALDVWENEPDIDVDLLEMADIGTPHIAGYSLDGKIGGMIMIYKSVCEYFGLEPKFDVGDFLPEPAVKELDLREAGGDDEQSVAEAVEKIYNIGDDDKRLRRIVDESEENRGAFFDGLRKNYPVRREFQNTEVVLDNADAALAAKLAGIGFQVSQK
ncbi:MAG: 4-phosphoerythronate dehydrogenase [Phycisphaerales bacterium]|nr:MAG: 4-phosphoerythronate dehydrogenase [Phycisphaerales bacterium]